MPEVQVESRTGRPTAEYIAASDLYAEPMNETAMKQRSAPRQKIGRRPRTNIPVKVYTRCEACRITQVTMGKVILRDGLEPAGAAR